jgi:hypothetical protein
MDLWKDWARGCTQLREIAVRDEMRVYNLIFTSLVKIFVTKKFS